VRLIDHTTGRGRREAAPADWCITSLPRGAMWTPSPTTTN
jgi:hypothetical protein